MAYVAAKRASFIPEATRRRPRRPIVQPFSSSTSRITISRSPATPWQTRDKVSNHRGCLALALVASSRSTSSATGRPTRRPRPRSTHASSGGVFLPPASNLTRTRYAAIRQSVCRQNSKMEVTGNASSSAENSHSLGVPEVKLALDFRRTHTHSYTPSHTRLIEPAGRSIRSRCSESRKNICRCTSCYSCSTPSRQVLGLLKSSTTFRGRLLPVDHEEVVGDRSFRIPLFETELRERLVRDRRERVGPLFKVH